MSLAARARSRTALHAQGSAVAVPMRRRIACSSNSSKRQGGSGGGPAAASASFSTRSSSATPRHPTLVVRASASDSNSTNRHAVLHDFCMTIPYGAITLVAGAVALALSSGANALAARAVAVGAAVVTASVLSLRAWKASGGAPGASTPYTLLSGVAAAWLASGAGPVLKAAMAAAPTATALGVGGWAAGAALALSSAAALFCVYNVAAGGNPPPKKRVAA